MEKILTAEEFYLKRIFETSSTTKQSVEIMIEFAKLHVEAALKEVLENVPYLASTDTVSYSQIEEAVLNSYPPENIK